MGRSLFIPALGSGWEGPLAAGGGGWGRTEDVLEKTHTIAQGPCLGFPPLVLLGAFLSDLHFPYNFLGLYLYLFCSRQGFSV